MNVMNARGAAMPRDILPMKKCRTSIWESHISKNGKPRHRFMNFMKRLRFDLKNKNKPLKERLQNDKCALASELCNNFICNNQACYNPY